MSRGASNRQMTLRPLTPLRLTHILPVLLLLALSIAGARAESPSTPQRSNWAVVVDASRYWFNYRHAANALGFYRELRDLGIPEDHIVLMLADDVACSPRNGYPGEVFLSQAHTRNVYGDAVQVDYRGPEVTVRTVLGLLEGRHAPGTPAHRRLDSDEHANVLLYFTGHGGDGFFKFQDREELLAADLADTVAAMAARGRFRELMIVFDTCQAGSMASRLRTPGVFSVASARTGESSYSYTTDDSVGLAIVDRFTYHTVAYLDGLKGHARDASTARTVFGSAVARTRMDQYVDHFSPAFTVSHVDTRCDLLNRSLREVLLTDFFANTHTRTHFVPDRVATDEWFQA